MGTTTSGNKRRWQAVSPAARRAYMKPAQDAAREKIHAKKLAAAIRFINESGGLRKAVERVKAAGVELEAAS